MIRLPSRRPLFHALVYGFLLSPLTAGAVSLGWFDDVSTTHLPPQLARAELGTLEADFGDLDGDGDVDIVMANDANAPLVLLWNDGTGAFLEYQLIFIPGRVAADADLGDVDGDGDLDIIVGIADFDLSNARNRLLINNGARSFSDETISRLPNVTSNTRDVDLVDVDLDGDLDVIVANVVHFFSGSGQQNRILINDGTGHFVDETLTSGAPHRFPLDESSTRSIVASDVDGDGDPDLALANRFDPSLIGTDLDGPQNKLWINDGQGFFTDETTARFPLDDLSARDVASGDVDGDGDLDLVFGNALGDNTFSGGGQQNSIYINDGLGFFTDETLNPDGTAKRLPVRSQLTKSVDLVDVDLDGDLDLLEANSRGENGFLAPQPGQQNRLLINDGTGFYSDESIRGFLERFRLPWRIDNSYDIDLADVDGDLDPDIFVAERDEPSRLLLNRSLKEMWDLYGP